MMMKKKILFTLLGLFTFILTSGQEIHDTKCDIRVYEQQTVIYYMQQAWQFRYVYEKWPIVERTYKYEGDYFLWTIGLSIDDLEIHDRNITAFIMNEHLIALRYAEYEGVNYLVTYTQKGLTDSKKNKVEIEDLPTGKVSGITVNDTLYLFFQSKADSLIKYYKAIYKEKTGLLNTCGIELLSQTPSVLDYNNICHGGNVSTSYYITPENKKSILIAFINTSNDLNKILLYKGIGESFEYDTLIVTPDTLPATSVYLGQGSIEGGMTGSWITQIGYLSAGHGYGFGPIHCELNMDNGVISDWKHSTISQYEEITSTNGGYFQYITNDGYHQKNKQLFLWFDNDGGFGSKRWNSDKLKFHRSEIEVPPTNMASEAGFDLISVVESAPPYALNGWDLLSQCGSAASTFNFEQQHEVSVSTNTNYTISEKVSGGIGPASSEFSHSFMNGHGHEINKSASITTTITPPCVDNDSAGLMWYIYNAPVIKRDEWRLCDYEGTVLNPDRSLFFFSIDNMVTLSGHSSLVDFGENSPRAYDLSTYEDRGVIGMNGIEKVVMKGAQLDAVDGLNSEISVEFDESHSVTSSQSYSLSVGLEGEHGIFNAGVEVSGDMEFERESQTTYSNGFDISWSNPIPMNVDDTTNVMSYFVLSYIMKTTDSSAYFLPAGFKQSKPYFITYEVDNIEYGAWDDYYYISNNELIEKYGFTGYPNPCSESINFKWSIAKKSNINLVIYNSMGLQIINMDKKMMAGEHNYQLETLNYQPGIYYISLMINSDLISGKFIVN